MLWSVSNFYFVSFVTSCIISLLSCLLSYVFSFLSFVYSHVKRNTGQRLANKHLTLGFSTTSDFHFVCQKLPESQQKLARTSVLSMVAKLLMLHVLSYSWFWSSLFYSILNCLYSFVYYPPSVYSLLNCLYSFVYYPPPKDLGGILFWRPSVTLFSPNKYLGNVLSHFIVILR